MIKQKPAIAPARERQKVIELERENDVLYKIKQKVVIANRELTEKLADAEADFDWMERNSDKILCMGGTWEYRLGGKGTRHDPWRWSNLRARLRTAIHQARKLHGPET